MLHGTKRLAVKHNCKISSPAPCVPTATAVQSSGMLVFPSLGLSADLQSQMPLHIGQTAKTVLDLSSISCITNDFLQCQSLPGICTWHSLLKEVDPLMAVIPFRLWRFGYKLVPTLLILPGTQPLPR